MPTAAPTRRAALKPGDLRREVLRIKAEITPNADVQFTGRVRTETVTYPTGYVQKHYVLPMAVNGQPLQARYEVSVGGTSILRFVDPR